MWQNQSQNTDGCCSQPHAQSKNRKKGRFSNRLSHETASNSLIFFVSEGAFDLQKNRLNARQNPEATRIAPARQTTAATAWPTFPKASPVCKYRDQDRTFRPKFCFA